MPRAIYGGFECRVRLDHLLQVASGLSSIHEVRDYDGMPVLVRVSLSKTGDGLVIEAIGCRPGGDGREARNAARDWERRLGEVMALPDGRNRPPRKA